MLNKELFTEDEMLEVMRNRFLASLISKETQYRQRFQEVCTYLKLTPYNRFPAVALVEPAGTFQEETEKRQYIKEVRDYLYRHERRFGRSVLFMDGEERLGLLFSWVSRDLIEVMNRTLKTEFLHPVVIGVGKPCPRLVDVHLSYRQAVSALQNKFYKDDEEVAYYEERIRYHSLKQYPFDQEKQLFECFTSVHGADEIAHLVEEFYASVLQEGPIVSKSIYELTIRLLFGIEKRVLAQLGVESVYKPVEITEVVQMKTFQQIKTFVAAYLMEVREVLVQHEFESHRSIIRKALFYMEQEFQTATLDSVSQKVYMTPTYLSSLFKMSTGKTFIEHLTDIRVHKAQEMLKNSHLKNYEVADHVGYKNSRYFSQIFKKKVGQSPSEYRDSLQRNGTYNLVIQ